MPSSWWMRDSPAIFTVVLQMEASDDSETCDMHPDVAGLLKLQLGLPIPSNVPRYKLASQPCSEATPMCYDDSDLSFDVVHLNDVTDGRAMSTIATHLFEKTGIIQKYALHERKLADFLHAIQSGYGKNPYHNSVHAANVLHHSHIILCRMGVDDLYKRLKVYIAAIIHDYAHIGLTNTYLVSTLHEFAITHNDISPMENHSIHAAFRVMAEHNFICDWPLHAQRCLRRDVISLVMSTDMTSHVHHMNQFIDSHDCDDPNSFSIQTLVDLKIALKCADLGHTFLPIHLHMRWVKLLEEECFLQGDQEHENGMPVSPLFDRSNHGITISQTHFFKIVVVPMVNALCDVYPQTKCVLDAVLANANYWNRSEDGRAGRVSRMR